MVIKPEATQNILPLRKIISSLKPEELVKSSSLLPITNHLLGARITQIRNIQLLMQVIVRIIDPDSQLVKSPLMCSDFFSFN